MKYSEILKNYNVLILKQADIIQALDNIEIHIYFDYLERRINNEICTIWEEQQVLQIKQKYSPLSFLSVKEYAELEMYEDKQDELKLTHLPTVILRLFEEKNLKANFIESKLGLKDGTIEKYIGTLEIEYQDLCKVQKEFGIDTYYFEIL